MIDHKTYPESVVHTSHGIDVIASVELPFFKVLVFLRSTTGKCFVLPQYLKELADSVLQRLNKVSWDNPTFKIDVMAHEVATALEKDLKIVKDEAKLRAFRYSQASDLLPVVLLDRMEFQQWLKRSEHRLDDIDELMLLFYVYADIHFLDVQKDAEAMSKDGAAEVK